MQSRTRSQTSASAQTPPPLPSGGRRRRTQATVKLYCLVHGDDPNQRAFSLDVTKTTTVSNLKELVKEKKKNMLSDIDADQLTLWLVNIHMDGLVTLSPDFAITDYGRKLSPFEEIQEAFPSGPARKHVHIVVELPLAFKLSAPTQQHMTTSTDQVDKSLANASQITPPSSNVPMNVVNSTPVRQTTASSLTSKKRRSIDSLLKSELEGILHPDVAEFIDKFFGSRRANSAVVAKVQSMLHTYPNNGVEEALFYGPFIELVNAISSKPSPSKIVSHDGKPLLGGDALRKPDLVGVNGNIIEVILPLHWGVVRFVGEVKPSRHMDIHGTDFQLASYAREVFGAQPNRRFVLGFTVCCTRMRLWLFDRSGGISSEMFDIKEDTEKFVRVISSLIDMNETELGYDLTIKMPFAEEEKYDKVLGVIDIKRHDKTERFVLVEVAFSRPVISGRATIVWKAFKKGEKPRKYYAIKDSWRDLTHGPEGEMLERVTRQLLSDYGKPLRVAEYYHHEDLKINGKDDDILVNIRKNLGPTPPVNRVHSRIILSTYGKPISKFSNNRQLLQVLRDAIEGHRRLWKANVLHRDISINNILIDDNGRGFIIDLDFAVYITRTERSQSVHRTGTGPFMAIDVLREKNHDYRHDVESFFYVLLWICSEFERPGKWRKTAKKGEKRLSEWWKGTFEAIAKCKITDMLYEFDEVLETFSRSFEELKDFVRKFHKLLFPPHHPDTATSSDIDYDEVIEVFNYALRMIDVTSEVEKMGLSKTKTRRS